MLRLVSGGLLTLPQARKLIAVNAGEAADLRKLLDPRAADVVIVFRRNVLRFFDVLSNKEARTWKRKSVR